MRSVVLLIALVAVGCGGGESNAPNPAFPDAAGVYSVTGDFDGIPSSEASFVGTVTLTQASRDAGTLGGSASMTATFEGDVATASDDALDQASVTATGTVTFQIVDPSGTWTFTGNLGNKTVTGGRHTLNVPGTGMISGNWTATRTASSSSATSIERNRSNLRAMVSDLLGR